MQNTEVEGHDYLFDGNHNVSDYTVDENLVDVRSIAQRIHNRLPDHVPLEDLVQAGVMGLIDAANKYDPARQVRFRTYAQFRIHGAIIDSIREMDWAPRHLRRRSRQVEEARHRLTGALSRSPTQPEIASELGIDATSLHDLLRDINTLQVDSLSERSGGGQFSRESACVDQPSDPFQHLLQVETKSLLSTMIAELSPIEQRVIALYYFEESPLTEVGQVINRSESRASQIHTKALAKLRVMLAQLPEFASRARK